MTSYYFIWSCDDDISRHLQLWWQQIVSLGALMTKIVSLGALTTTDCITWSSDDNRLCRLEQWRRQHRQTWSKRSIVPSASWRLGRWRQRQWIITPSAIWWSVRNAILCAVAETPCGLLALLHFFFILPTVASFHWINSSTTSLSLSLSLGTISLVCLGQGQTCWKQAFSSTFLWNNLPVTVRSCHSLSSFKRKPRVHLEAVTYDGSWQKTADGKKKRETESFSGDWHCRCSDWSFEI